MKKRIRRKVFIKDTAKLICQEPKILESLIITSSTDGVILCADHIIVHFGISKKGRKFFEKLTVADIAEDDPLRLLLEEVDDGENSDNGGDVE